MKKRDTYLLQKMNSHEPPCTFYRQLAASLRAEFGTISSENYETWEGVQCYFEDRYDELEKALAKLSAAQVADFAERLNDLISHISPVDIPEEAYWRGIVEALEDEADTLRRVYLGE